MIVLTRKQMNMKWIKLLENKLLNIYKNFLIKPKVSFVKNPYKKSDVIFSEKDINKFDSITNQTCYSKNKSNPSNLLDNEFNIYITHDKLLMPCCMIPPNISNSIHHHSGQESPYQKEVLNKMLEIGFDKFSLKNSSSIFFHSTHSG